MRIGVNELLTRPAERLTTLVLLSLVPEQIDVLVAVLALEMIFADLLEYVLLVTVSSSDSTVGWQVRGTLRCRLVESDQVTECIKELPEEMHIRANVEDSLEDGH